MSDFFTLREANVARDIEWNTGTEKVSPLFRGVELAGEVGEVLEVVAKIERGDYLQHKDALAQELADIAICVDLVAMDYGIDMNNVPESAFEGIEEQSLNSDNLLSVIDLAAEVGKALNTIKKLERERLGIKGSRDTLENLARLLARTVAFTILVSDHYDIDLEQATKDKFNATSIKVGLNTRLV